MLGALKIDEYIGKKYQLDSVGDLDNISGQVFILTFSFIKLFYHYSYEIVHLDFTFHRFCPFANNF